MPSRRRRSHASRRLIGRRGDAGAEPRARSGANVATVLGEKRREGLVAGLRADDGAKLVDEWHACLDGDDRGVGGGSASASAVVVGGVDERGDGGGVLEIGLDERIRTGRAHPHELSRAKLAGVRLGGRAEERQRERRAHRRAVHLQ